MASQISAEKLILAFYLSNTYFFPEFSGIERSDEDVNLESYLTRVVNVDSDGFSGESLASYSSKCEEC